jgi:GR25 family glycosyltransferase involved in LPS biosynthesis
MGRDQNMTMHFHTELKVRPPSLPAMTNTARKKKNVEIAVISLPKAVQRRENVASMFAGSGLDWTYFDAHTGAQHPDLRYDVRAIKRHFGRTLSAPEIGVYSSHYAILKAFLQESSCEFILVLEDDVLFDVDFPLEDFAAFCTEKGIDYIRLFGKHYAKAVRVGFFFDRSIIRYESSPAGAQAYMMSRAGARMFTEKFRSIEATVDLAMDQFWESKMPVFSIFPYPAIERFSPTSIPMQPYAGELAAVDRLIWTFNRMFNKLRKICANVMLARWDGRMREEFPAFRQII